MHARGRATYEGRLICTYRHRTDRDTATQHLKRGENVKRDLIPLSFLQKGKYTHAENKYDQRFERASYH